MLMKLFCLCIIIKISQTSALSEEDEQEHRATGKKYVTPTSVTNDMLSYDEDSNSENEEKAFKQNFKSFWAGKRQEIQNLPKRPENVPNMVAARPWGQQCGDPNQHDVPWGSCVLSSECEAETRIFRGDMYCGNTIFVCCAVLFTDQEWDHALLPEDISFEDSDLYEDEQEKRERKAKKSQIAAHHHEKQEKKLKRQKSKRKRLIKKLIRKIISTMNLLLKKMFRHNTRDRVRAIKKYRKIVKTMKNEFLQNKDNTLKLHEGYVNQIEHNIYKSLQTVMDSNLKFVENVTNTGMGSGGFSPQNMAMLMEAYPELDQTLRSGPDQQSVSPNLPDPSTLSPPLFSPPVRRRSGFNDRSSDIWTALLLARQ